MAEPNYQRSVHISVTLGGPIALVKTLVWSVGDFILIPVGKHSPPLMWVLLVSVSFSWSVSCLFRPLVCPCDLEGT
jgi:hypothetical protein